MAVRCLGISNWAAQRWVAAAHALERLPLISDALESGTLCLDKVVELARFATPETERNLIAWATRVSGAAIRRRADRAARAALDDVRDAERSRFVRWWYFDDGTRLGLEGEFPAAEGAAITRALRRVADRLPEVVRDQCVDDAFEPSDQDVLETRLADALVAIASQAMGDDCDADRATVVVHTALATVDGRRFGEIEGGPVIHPEVARRLACDARLQFVLTDQEGNAVGIGRTARDVPPWLMRQLRFRDHGCTFPGCGARAFLHAHHMWHWEDGGPTDLNNLVLVCHFHHKLVARVRMECPPHRIDRPVVQAERPSLRAGPGPT
ncbi:MAG: HNH endonuclease [Actinomycetota bacterium]